MKKMHIFFNLTNWKCKLFEVGVNGFMWKMLSVKDSLHLKIKKHKKYKICVTDLVSHRGITVILFDRPDTARLLFWRLSVCTLSFDGLKSPLLMKCFSNLNLFQAVKSSGLVVQLNWSVCWWNQLMMTSSKQRKFTCNCLLKNIKES